MLTSWFLSIEIDLRFIQSLKETSSNVYKWEAFQIHPKRFSSLNL